MIRWTRPQDRQEIQDLWRLRFGDSEAFMDWFFHERFSPNHSVVSIEDGRVVSSIQSYPNHIRIRGAILPCTVIAGVSTLPEYEGQGHMGRAMRFYMNGIAQKGGTVVPYRPENFATYASRGHFPVNTTAYFQTESLQSADLPKPDGLSLATPLDFRLHESAIHSCYYRFSCRYSGILNRSLADIRLKLADYAVSGGAGIGVWEDAELCGYCAYFHEDAAIYCEEVIANDPQYEALLMHALLELGRQKGKPLRGKLPSDTKLAIPGLTIERRPMGVMGIGDAAAFLHAVGRTSAFRAEIIDATVHHNNGVFDFAGKPSGLPPHIRIEAGRLAQFLCGYRSLANLQEEGLVTVLDSAAALELDALFPPQSCYIVDEY